VSSCIPKLFLVRVIMKVVRNTVEYVKFIIVMKVCLVLVAGRLPQLLEKTKKD
jgi:hypothetical protein